MISIGIAWTSVQTNHWTETYHVVLNSELTGLLVLHSYAHSTILIHNQLFSDSIRITITSICVHTYLHLIFLSLSSKGKDQIMLGKSSSRMNEMPAHFKHVRPFFKFDCSNISLCVKGSVTAIFKSNVSLSAADVLEQLLQLIDITPQLRRLHFI